MNAHAHLRGSAAGRLARATLSRHAPGQTTFVAKFAGPNGANAIAKAYCRDEGEPG